MMLVNRVVLTLLVISMSILGTVACTPNIQGQPAAELAVSADTEMAAIQTDSGEGVDVDVTPMSDAELASQPVEETEPGASAADEGSQLETETQEFFQTEKSVYTDAAYKFSVDYPTNFVVSTLPIEKLTPLNPQPTTSAIFMNPETAASDLADTEPADLEIRVYTLSQTGSIEGWLTSTGLLPTDGSGPMKTFEAANVSGVQVCASTMIAPGCAYFFIGDGWVYQLTPATLVGEAMAKTFSLIP